MHPFNLEKVELTKPGQAFNLEKPEGDFDAVVINLNWNRAVATPEKKGFFGKLFGGNTPVSSSDIDLDLGVLYELKDGSKGVVQALGNSFGSYKSAPYIELDGDDRTGESADGETIRINGANWSKIKRIAVYAFIYEGAPNWDHTDGVVTITTTDAAPIEVRMTGGRNDRPLCGIVTLTNDNGKIAVRREVQYYSDQGALDKAHNWGMRWVAGRK